MMATATIGVIGGSGVYQIDGLRVIEEVSVATPFGLPSDMIVVGELDGAQIAFLPRHGRGHRINPTDVNYRANIFALKQLGVERVISLSAVGSLREDIAPLDVVLPDQIIDRTIERSRTFFDRGIVVHVSIADPFCPDLRAALAASAEGLAPHLHREGTYVCIEGPQFSTKAESQNFRQWGASVIGMTAMPEARLAREAELCYATVALVTDYDVWHTTVQPVTVDMVVANLQQNAAVAREILSRVVARLPQTPNCACGHALAGAIATDPAAIGPDVRQRLGLLIRAYV